MQDRILLNGTWYIREDKSPSKESPREILDREITRGYTLTYETDNWCFVSNHFFHDDCYTLDGLYPDPFIDITDKRGEGSEWITDSSDNPIWMIGVLNGDPESMKDANEIFDEEGLIEFRNFITYLIKNNLLKND
jgi:hypothetical protein